MRRCRSSILVVSALAALALAALSTGLHGSGDNLIAEAGTTTVFASSHPGTDVSEHLDPETVSETVVCVGCLQQLERRTDLLGPTGATPAALAAAAADREHRLPLAAAPLQSFSSRAPPQA